MRISDWSSDVCSSDLNSDFLRQRQAPALLRRSRTVRSRRKRNANHDRCFSQLAATTGGAALPRWPTAQALRNRRSEEHTSELQSLMRISYAVFCLKKKKQQQKKKRPTNQHNETTLV